MTETPSDNLDLSIAPGELDDEISRAIEAVVMVAEQPVPVVLLAQLCEAGEQLIEAHCDALASAYETEGRGFVLARVAGGYRFQSHPDQAPYVERYVLDGQSSRLSAAALETLAIVAYKQPISRAQVAAIRGVNVDAVMRTLDQRGYIAEFSRDPGPGQAVLFGTTQLFLEKVGLDSLDDLPGLGDFVPGPEVVEQLEAGLRVDDTVPLADELVTAEGPEPDAGLEHEHEPSSDVDLTDQPVDEGHSDPEVHPGQPDAVVIEMPDRTARRD
ncbi:MAG: SMC-Scp complex subunit ScpB [Acidimicrobiia bacterium]|nr:SMC-Scp complex subunit ScpB [Acidimicrobiia bacterium]